MCTEQQKELLANHVRGLLSENEARKVEELLESSEALRNEYESIKAYYEAIGSLKPLKASPDFLDKVHARIDRQGWAARLADMLMHPLPVKLPIELAGLAVTIILVVLIVDPFRWIGTPPGREPRHTVTDKLREAPPVPQPQIEKRDESKKQEDITFSKEKPETMLKSAKREQSRADLEVNMQGMRSEKKMRSEPTRAKRGLTVKAADAPQAAPSEKPATAVEQEQPSSLSTPAASAAMARARASELMPLEEKQIAEAPAPTAAPSHAFDDSASVPVMTLALSFSDNEASYGYAKDDADMEETKSKPASRRMESVAAGRRTEGEPAVPPQDSEPAWSSSLLAIETVVRRHNGTLSPLPEKGASLALYEIELPRRNLPALRRDLAKYGLLSGEAIGRETREKTIRFQLKILE